MSDTTFLDYVQKKNLQRKDIGNIDLVIYRIF